MSETASHIGDGDGGIRIHPPMLAAGLLIAGLLLHLLGGHHHHGAVHFHQFAGLLMVAAGVGVLVLCGGDFLGPQYHAQSPWTADRIGKIPPFTFTRNPMYLGPTTILLGFAIFFWSPAMLLAPIMFFLVSIVIIPRKRHALERTFSESPYHGYTNSARPARWLRSESTDRDRSSQLG